MANSPLENSKLQFYQKSISFSLEQLERLKAYKKKGYNVSHIIRHVLDMLPENFENWHNLQISEKRISEKEPKTHSYMPWKE